MDLYYRLAVVELVVPPLREHREDIPELAVEFTRRYGARFGNPEVRLSPGLIDTLCQAEWPGNVRQLENAAVKTPGALYFTYWQYGASESQTPIACDQGLLVPGRPPLIRTHANEGDALSDR